ncbi:NrsF family protein [Tabrizicola sp.]|uniref:NrsF family protein n=1 Tax=Tabrizicola sp. TaxID=2005166 RepID=UPI0035AF0E57
MTARRSTEDLIRDLAATPVPARFSPGFAGCVLGVLMLGGLALYFAVFGLRPDLGSAWTHLPVQAKSILPALLSLLAIWLAFASARPEGRVLLWPLAIPVLLAFVLVLFRIATADGALVAEAIGQTALACLSSIAMISALPLAIGIAFLRRSAPTRPVLTGALLGVAIGAGVAAGYGLHCAEDSPLFFLSWYGLAIGIVGGVGGLLGHRFLRW